MRGAILILGAMGIAVAPLNAQAVKGEPPIEQFSETDISDIDFPDTEFEETPSTIKNYEKYFYFHRDETDFSRAFADVKECDALSSGLRHYRGNSEPYPGYYGGQYGIGGAIGGMIGNAMAAAIFGSAEKRKTRRTNMRRCMGFKGYDRYGLAKDKWKEFHFEEGLSTVKDGKRRDYLLMQARVASGPKPEQERLGQ
jgi:hypothetical protein